jgi:hypothetical protein
LGDVGVGWPAKVHESRLQDRFVGRNTRVNAITWMVCGPRVSRWRCSSSSRNDSRRHKKAVYVLICDRRTLSVRCDAETLFWGIARMHSKIYNIRLRTSSSTRSSCCCDVQQGDGGGWVGGWCACGHHRCYCSRACLCDVFQQTPLAYGWVGL